jgi:predicted Fe-Mo cluster-binding NifX family protein
VAWASAAGWRLDDWQEYVVEGMLGLGEDDRFASFEDGLNVARQNGKGVVLQVIEGFCAFELGYPVVMHTAHEFATSQEHQLRFEGMIQDSPALHSRVRDKGGYVHANGQESIRLKSGARIIFKARTKGGGRGYSGDLLVWDEAMVIPESVVGAQFPMQRASTARHGPKVIYAGSAVDQEIHDYGVPWARMRERGMAGEPGIAYFEWSAPFESLQEMTEDVLLDRSWWPQANPAMGVRIDPEHMEREIRSMASRTAAVELGGVGDWPRTDGLADTVIAIVAWDALEDSQSVLQPPVCVAFDVSPERRTSIAFAGRNQNDDWHVEIQEHRAGTGWVVERLVEMLERVDVEVVVCDGVGPAASLIVPLSEAGVTVETVNTTEHGQACGRLVDMVAEGSLAHLGSAELRDAVRGSKARTLGDSWAWSRRSSLVDISPLVAATLALGAAAGVTATTDWSIF